MVMDPGERLKGYAMAVRLKKGRSEPASRFGPQVTALLETIQEGYCALDAQGRFTYVNAAAEQMLGRSRRALLGKSFAEALSPTADSALRREQEEAIRCKAPARFVAHFPTPQDVWCEVRVIPSAEGVSVHLRDVTDRKRAEELARRERDSAAEIARLEQELEACRESREQARVSEDGLALALAATGLGTFDWDLTTDRMVWSERCKVIFGLPPGAAVNLDAFRARIHPDDREQAQQLLRRAFDPTAREGDEHVAEYRVIRPDGSVGWIASMGRVLFGDVGGKRRAVRFLATVLDLTDSREAQRELLFQKYALDQHAIVAITNAKGTITYVNEKFCQISKYSREELLGKNHRIINSGYHPKSFFKQMYATIGRGEVWRGDLRNRAKDGSIYWVDTTIVPARNEAGRVTHYVAIRADITERKRAEEALQAAHASLRDREARLRAIVETAVDAIITIDERGAIESVNPAAERLFGHAAAELIGQNVKMLMPEPYSSEHDHYLHTYLRTGRKRIIGIGREVEGLRKEGTTFPMHLSISEFRVGDQRMFTGIVHDVSGRRRLERQIVEAAAAEQQRIGQDLHDGLCQHLLGTAFSADLLARQLATAQHSAEAAAAGKVAVLLRDGIRQARGLAHGLNPINLDGGGLADALAGLAGQVAEQFRIACAFRADDGLPPIGGAAALHLYRIAQEAVSNAIRHGKCTRIDIRLGTTGGGGGRGAALSIRDNGIGLPKARPANDEAPRVGIGLSTMAYRARLVGGLLRLKPAPGLGTIVTCSFPIRPDAPEPGAAARAGQRGRQASTAPGDQGRMATFRTPSARSPKSL